VRAPIIVAFGDRFPMIRRAQGARGLRLPGPALVTGQFDPTTHRAVWPSTGNYCRGGVAISRIMGCRGVAVLPEGMSEERFDWLERWVADPATSSAPRAPRATSRRSTTSAPSSNATRQRDLQPVLRVRKHLGHFARHRARARAHRSPPARANPRLRLAAFVSATGSAGTHGRRRLPEGPHGTRDRRGRGARVPDDALQRLRRAQHPGHRRQAHPADPQRHRTPTWWEGPYTREKAIAHAARYLDGTADDHLRELTYADRKALHNFKYFTWVEQQGRTTEELRRLWDEDFWADVFSPAQIQNWDRLITQFNDATGVAKTL
jgi:hypothetical protein